MKGSPLAAQIGVGLTPLVLALGENAALDRLAEGGGLLSSSSSSQDT